MKSETIISAVCSVTKKWEKQRKAEERNSRTRERRRTMGEGQVAFTEVAHLILPAAYKHASGNSDRPVHNRQLYYAAREAFLEMTGKEIDANYFTQTLVRKYVNQHQPDWNLVADPRGNFTIPNSISDVHIPCGTLQVDKYLEERLTKDCEAVDPYPVEWPSIAEHARFKAVLYIEKEGFEPLLDEAKIAERFDLAIIGCKGQSVAAARKLVDRVCRVNGGVPLFIVHDFDKSGFEIAECLTEVSDWAVDNDRVAYPFENEINFVDFGLRLDDAKKYKLNSERVKKKVTIKSSYVTDEERAFLESRRRIELNAFTAPQFIEWLESKLVEQLGKKRLIPDDETLAKAYQRATLIARVNAEIERLKTDFEDVDCDVKQLRRLLKKEMQSDPAKSFNPPTWDRALYDIAERHDRERIGDQEKEA